MVVFLLVLCLAGALVFAACDNSSGNSNKLPAPQNLNVTDKNFVWDEVENASGYYVQIDNNPSIDNRNSTSYSIADLSVGTHTLKVKAIGGEIEKPDGSLLDGEAAEETPKTGKTIKYTDSSWASISHTVSPVMQAVYDIEYILGDGGTNHSGNPKTYTSTSAAITLKDPSRSGYIFAYWEEGNTIPTGSSGNKTFTAVWAEIYSISYVLGEDGINHPDNPDEYSSLDLPLTIKAPSRDGYIFIRWEEGKTIPAGSSGNKTFTAV